MAKPETLKRVLVEHNVDKNIINKINNGYENVTNKSAKKKKA
jgi:hemerythrin-like domain-containing protein